MEKPEIRQRKVPRIIPPGVKTVKKKELFRGRSPDVFEWGWTKMPLVSRFLISGTFLTVIALGVPYWAHVDWDMGETAHFGLFVYCPGVLQATCSSIHDNLVPGRDVPLWYHFTQVSYFIGAMCGALSMFVVYSNHEGRHLAIPPTTKNMALLMATVAVIQLTISIYTFFRYFEYTDFLYLGQSEVSFHGSFYAAVLGDVLYAVGVAMLLLHDESAAHIELRRRVAALRRRRRLGDAAINDAVAAGSSAYKALSELKFLQRQLGVEDDAVQISVPGRGVPTLESESWGAPPAAPREEPSEPPMGQTLVKVVDPDSVYHYTAQDYIVKHSGGGALDLETLARATGGRNYTPKHTDVTQEPPTPYSEETLEQAEERRKREAREKEEKRTKEEERKREEARKKEEEERKREEDLPPWVRARNAHHAHTHTHARQHCQCIHTQQWVPVSASIVANQPNAPRRSGPTIRELN